MHVLFQSFTIKRIYYSICSLIIFYLRMSMISLVILQENCCPSITIPQRREKYCCPLWGRHEKNIEIPIIFFKGATRIFFEEEMFYEIFICI